MVFGTTGTSITSGDTMIAGKKYSFYQDHSQYLSISYFINGSAVKKESYLSSFDKNTTMSRNVSIKYRSDYGTCEGVSPFQPIFYGTTVGSLTDPLSVGGKIVFINH